jgi:alpha-L-arabinofuranosidase
MRDGVSVKIQVDSPTFSGETLPKWIAHIKGHPKDLDASAVLCSTAGKKSLRVAVVNRNERESYEVPLRVAFETIAAEVEVHELWHEDVKARNGWGKEDEVSVKTRKEKWEGKWIFREHSFTLLILELV